ncbi:MAG: hypothetical protein NTX50_19025 [Candidatus Sumerlaeota bacterium]|nr:hypothetical protein [Candidatus Sumerlaeota bacterium]
MTPRLRRLEADHRDVQTAFQAHPFIRILAADGTPPEKYAFEISVQGLAPLNESGFMDAAVHRAEVFLPMDYPRRPPFCRMLTPVFHPNIDPQKICIGDHWSAGQSLPALIVQIAQMICFQSYNVKSPLNAAAAAWAETNAASLPLDRSDLNI